MKDQLVEIVMWLVLIVGTLVGLAKARRKASARPPVGVPKVRTRKPPSAPPRRRRHLIDASSLTQEDLDEMEREFGTAGTRPEDYKP